MFVDDTHSTLTNSSASSSSASSSSGGTHSSPRSAGSGAGSSSHKQDWRTAVVDPPRRLSSVEFLSTRVAQERQRQSGLRERMASRNQQQEQEQEQQPPFVFDIVMENTTPLTSPQSVVKHKVSTGTNGSTSRRSSKSSSSTKRKSKAKTGTNNETPQNDKEQVGQSSHSARSGSRRKKSTISSATATPNSASSRKRRTVKPEAMPVPPNLNDETAAKESEPEKDNKNAETEEEDIIQMEPLGASPDKLQVVKKTHADINKPINRYPQKTKPNQQKHRTTGAHNHTTTLVPAMESAAADKGDDEDFVDPEAPMDADSSKKSKTKRKKRKTKIENDSPDDPGSSTPVPVENGAATTEEDGMAQEEKDLKEEEEHVEWWLYVLVLALTCCVVGVMFIVVLVVFDATGRLRGDDDDPSDTVNDAIESILGDSATLDDSSSPQARAFDWLVTTEKDLVGDYSDDQIRSRFALAVLWFSTGGADGRWTKAFSFLSSKHECQWTDSGTGGQSGVLCDVDNRIVGLRLPSNGLQGTIPVELNGLKDLQNLNLATNKLSSSIPMLALNATLTTLDLKSNALSGNLPESLGWHSRMTSIDISDNTLSGTFPSTMSGLSNLETFRFGNNQFVASAASLESFFGSWTKLLDFDCSSNGLGGSLDFLKNADASRFARLNAASNGIQGTVPTLLASFSKLESLDLSNNLLQGSLAANFGANLGALKEFFLQSNRINDMFPWSSFANGALESVSIANNRFTGGLPSDIGSTLSALKRLDVSGNDFMGVIPSSIGGLQQLTTMKASENGFSGSMPSTIGLLVGLVELDLSFNSFTDSIPSEIGNLKAMEDLLLNENMLSGDIPAQMARLTSLRTMDVSRNPQLSGDLTALCNFDAAPKMFADCNGDPPPVQCGCCQVCF